MATAELPPKAAEKVEDDELKSALDQARASDRITVILVPTEPEKRVTGFETWWDVPVAEVSEQLPVEQARRTYERELARERPFF